ncbi:MAG: hypothetical protein JWL63_949 [Rhodocyclales bacterium]|nr:hypothetical protein [Rhodocyclales bacterium]
MSDVQGNQASPQLSLAGATLFAMTRYVECPCPENAALVARHLECAAEQNDGDARLADLCSALAFCWRGRIMQQLTSDQQKNEQHDRAH